MNPKVEWLLKRPRYQRALMLVGVLLVVVGLFVYAFYLPLQEDLSKLVKKDESLERQLVNDRRIAGNLPKFRAEYEKMVAQLDQALTELPNDKEIPKLLTSIAAAAKENGLEVLLFKPGGEKKRAFYAEVPVTLKLIGTFHQVANFFYDVGNLPRIVNLSDVNMGLGKQSAGKLNLSVNCLATTFRFLDPSEIEQTKKKKKKKKK